MVSIAKIFEKIDAPSEEFFYTALLCKQMKSSGTIFVTAPTEGHFHSTQFTGLLHFHVLWVTRNLIYSYLQRNSIKLIFKLFKYRTNNGSTSTNWVYCGFFCSNKDEEN